MGLVILESADASKKIETGDEIEIDISKGEIKNTTKNETYTVKPIPEFMQKLVTAGGLLEYIKSI